MLDARRASMETMAGAAARPRLARPAGWRRSWSSPRSAPWSATPTVKGLPGIGGEPPLIRAEAGPYRHAPDDRGGLDVANPELQHRRRAAPADRAAAGRARCCRPGAAPPVDPTASEPRLEAAPDAPDPAACRRSGRAATAAATGARAGPDRDAGPGAAADPAGGPGRAACGRAAAPPVAAAEPPPPTEPVPAPEEEPAAIGSGGGSRAQAVDPGRSARGGGTAERPAPPAALEARDEPPPPPPPRRAARPSRRRGP